MVRGIKLYNCYYMICNSRFATGLRINYKREGSLIYNLSFQRIIDFQRSVIYEDVPKDDFIFLARYSNGFITDKKQYISILNKTKVLTTVSKTDLNCSLFSARNFTKQELYLLSNKNGDFEK